MKTLTERDKLNLLAHYEGVLAEIEREKSLQKQISDLQALLAERDNEIKKLKNLSMEHQSIK